MWRDRPAIPSSKSMISCSCQFNSYPIHYLLTKYIKTFRPKYAHSYSDNYTYKKKRVLNATASRGVAPSSQGWEPCCLPQMATARHSHQCEQPHPSHSDK